jgi:hypothetical protein
MVLAAGSLSLVLSIFHLATGFRLPFHFAYVSGQINLTIVSRPIDTFIWIISVLSFSIFPALSKQGGRFFRFVHGFTPFSVVLLLTLPVTFPLLAANNILAVLITVRNSYRLFHIPQVQAAAFVSSVIFLLIIPVEVLASFSFLSNPVALLKLYQTASFAPLLGFGRLSLNLFFLGDVLAGYLLILLMFLPIILVAGRRRGGLVRAAAPSNSGVGRGGLGGKAVFLLIIVVCVAAFTATLPYLFQPVPMGVDASFYLKESAGNLSVNLIRVEPRAAYILLLLVFRSFLKLPPVSALALGAVFLSSLSVLGTFFLAEEAVGRTDLALLSAFWAGLSPQLLVGTFAGIFEAWLVYSEGLFLFGLVLHTWKTLSLRSAAGAILVSIIVLFTHAWSWLLLLLILAGQTLVIFTIQSKSARRLSLGRGLRLEVLVLLASVLVGMVVVILGAVSLPAVEVVRDLAFQFLMAGIRSPVYFMGDMSVSLVYYVGGFYSNWVLLLVGVIGVYGAWGLGREVKGLLASWVLVPGLLSLFFSSEVQWRLFYLLPYSFLAAVGVVCVLGWFRDRMLNPDQPYPSLLLFHLLEWSSLTAVSLIFWNDVLRSMVFVSASF